MDRPLNDEVHLVADSILDDYVILRQEDLTSQGKTELFDKVLTAEVFKHWFEEFFVSLKDYLFNDALG